MAKKEETTPKDMIQGIIILIVLIFAAFLMYNKENVNRNSEDKQFTISYTPYYCKVKKANVRSKPNTSSTIIGKVKLGDEIKVLDKSNNWYQIYFKGRRGWIYSNLVSINKIEILARVFYEGEYFYITNLNNFDWENVIFKLNYGITDAYRAKRKRVKAGSTIKISCFDFINNSGKRFNIYTHAPQRFMIWPRDMKIGWWEGRFR